MMEVPHKDKFKPLLKEMKSYTYVLFVGVTAICLSCNHKSIDSDKHWLPINLAAIKCYHFWSENDSISLTIEYKGDSIKGNLIYKLFEKDKNIGVIQGLMKDDLLIADYTFQSEGLQSVRQVIFKKVGDNLIEGYGEIESRNARSYFTTIDSLKFNDSIVLKAAKCAGSYP